MPSVSDKQHRAMEAAKNGESTLGIPQSVGEEFVNADEAKARKGKGSFARAMQSHGFAAGTSKRHPSTSHYKGEFAPHRRGR